MMTMTQSVDRTRMSLLVRLRDDELDQRAWSEFVAAYGKLIYRWCRNWHLQEADAEDVTQAVLLKLAVKLRTFEYDRSRSFRAYLRTIARYAWCDWLEQQELAGSGDSQVHCALHSVQAREDLLEQLNEQFDQELMRRAMEDVENRVEPHTWEAFRLTAVDGLSGADVAEQLGMKVATVFKARSKVQKMLSEAIHELEGTTPLSR